MSIDSLFGGETPAEVKGDEKSVVMFDLLLMAKRLEEEGFTALLYVKRAGKPLIVSSHRDKDELVRVARDILSEAIC